MSYDVDLADRVRRAMPSSVPFRERAMFGGLAFMVDGHMALAVSGRGGLMVRIDRAPADEFSIQPGVSPTVMRGRRMSGWLDVATEALRTEEELAHWVTLGVAQAIVSLCSRGRTFAGEILNHLHRLRRRSGVSESLRMRWSAACRPKSLRSITLNVVQSPAGRRSAIDAPDESRDRVLRSAGRNHRAPRGGRSP